MWIARLRGFVRNERPCEAQEVVFHSAVREPCPGAGEKARACDGGSTGNSHPPAFLINNWWWALRLRCKEETQDAGLAIVRVELRAPSEMEIPILRDQLSRHDKLWSRKRMKVDPDGPAPERRCLT